MANNDEELKSLVDNYLKAIKTGDPTIFRQVFLPEALVIYPEDPDKRPKITPIEPFAKGIADTISKEGKIEEVPLDVKYYSHRNIASITVNFDLTIGNTLYTGTDYFNVVKSEGKWRIAQKIYEMIPKTNQ